MHSLLLTNIQQLFGIREQSRLLRGKELAALPVINQAYLLLENGLIKAYGSMTDLTELSETTIPVMDLSGQTVLPSWCDSHTHLVFAASREHEFIDKICGLSYAAIAAKGGGILNSAEKIKDTPEAILFEQAWQRLQEIIKLGTGAVEIKSGY